MAVDVVAVSAQPLTWAIFCEECDSYIDEPTTDGYLVDDLCEKHEKAHTAGSI